MLLEFSQKERYIRGERSKWVTAREFTEGVTCNKLKTMRTNRLILLNYKLKARPWFSCQVNDVSNHSH